MNQVKAQIPKKILRPRTNVITDKKISAIAIVFVLIQLLNNSIFPMLIRPLNAILQIGLYSSFIAILFSSFPRITFQPKSILLIIGTAASILLNDINTKYGTGVRWILWLMLLSSVGPMFSSKVLLLIRYKILKYFLKGFVIVTVLSFIYKILGLADIGRGNFAGLMNQSMVLGPVAAISGIYSFYNYLSTRIVKFKIFYLTLAGLSGLVVILASSRLAFAGYIAGMIFLFAKPFKHRFLYTVIVIVFGLSVFSRIDDGSTEVEQSIDKGMVEKGMNNSREMLWNDRIKEFKENPIFGVGFSAQDDELIESENASLGGRIEPGSGYLMILSMTGLFGLSMFIWYMYFLFNNRRFWREIFKNEVYKLSILAFFAVHFIGEGYIYSAGSMLASFFWLIIGITFPYDNIKKYHIKRR